MRIKEISLKNFKRFTDLTIKDIPESAKLVLLIGANGSGKSSVFDAFNIASVLPWNLPFYTKHIGSPPMMKFYFFDGCIIISEDFGKRQMNVRDVSKRFYGRSSSRIVPRIPLPDLQKSIVNNEDAPPTFIDQDVRFNTDIYEYIREINAAVRSPFIQGKQPNSSDIFNEYFARINESFSYIFGEGKTAIKIIDMVDSIPGVPAELLFQKGDSRINYDLLSHGEKQVVTLLLDFVIRRKYYQDTIYFIDEMDTHIETTIQKRLIKDIVEKWIPGGSQLWTASHALGFIEYANKSDNAVILDFDNLDFDIPQVIYPSPKDNAEVYEIAVGKEFLPSLLKKYKVYFVENKDKELYATIGLDNILFISDNNRNSVYHKIKSGDNFGIVDRDFLTDDDIATIKANYKNLVVLNYYSIENYLYHPDNMDEYFAAKNMSFDKTQYIADITVLKNSNAPDLLISLALTRTSYPYFGEPQFNDKPEQNRFKNKEENMSQSRVVGEMLNSNDFETFYKVFPMKTFSGALAVRQNISRPQLTQTDWFKTRMKELLA